MSTHTKVSIVYPTISWRQGLHNPTTSGFPFLRCACAPACPRLFCSGFIVALPTHFLVAFCFSWSRRRRPWAARRAYSPPILLLLRRGRRGTRRSSRGDWGSGTTKGRNRRI